LLVQRTTAKEQRRRIVAAFPVEWEQAKGSFFVENHLNLIVPIKGVTPLSPEVVLALLNSRLFDFIFRTTYGNNKTFCEYDTEWDGDVRNVYFFD
jgi:adenine-specific DNA-methyltransferase